jgi:hypothetical protein
MVPLIYWDFTLKRVFQIDIESCSHCGGKLRVIACTEDPLLIAKILAPMRSREAATAKAAPRGPPDAVVVGLR